MGSLASQAADLKVLFLKAATDLDEHYRNVNHARIVGSSISATGSVMAIAAGLAAPFTGGASLVVAAGTLGCGLATAGGLTSTGASFVGYLLKEDKLAEMHKKWESFRETLIRRRETCDYVDDLIMFGKDAAKVIKGVRAQKAAAAEFRETAALSKAAKDAKEVSSLAKEAGELTKQATKLTEKATKLTKEATRLTKEAGKATNEASKLAKEATRLTREATKLTKAANALRAKDTSALSKLAAASKTPIVLVNVVSLGLSIYDIIDASEQLEKKESSPGGNLLRRLAAELDMIA